MVFHVCITDILNCDLTHAFKTPMLCDVTQIHTGYGLMPRITHVEDDENWGQIGSSKRIFAAKSFSQPGGFVSMDHIVDRIENKKWHIRVDTFQSWMLGFYKFEGLWETQEISQSEIQIKYIYYLYGKGLLWIPFQWLFARLFWKKYMKHVFQNVAMLINNHIPLIYV